jgi:hypothetical protein
MRRALFGYRPADVDAALAARDAELAELRQDVAALWLAFAQHDRLLRGDSPEQPRAAGPEADPSEPADADPASDPAIRAASIGAQLSELDHVLSAIEDATRTLERTYASEVGRPGGESPGPEGGSEAAGETGGGDPEPEDEPQQR